MTISFSESGSPSVWSDLSLSLEPFSVSVSVSVNSIMESDDSLDDELDSELFPLEESLGGGGHRNLRAAFRFARLGM